jgi:primosomal protein N' (replication factor Y)
MDRYAKVIILSNSKAIDNLYTYKIIDNFLDDNIIGLKVLVPFGNGNALREAFVFETTDSTEFKRIKEIKYILQDDISLSINDIDLIKFMKNEYLCTYSEALQLIVPSGTKLKRVVNYKFIKNDFEGIIKEKEIEIFEFIKENNIVSYSDIKNKFENCSKYLKTIENKGLVSKEYKFKSEIKEKFKETVVRKMNCEDIIQIRESIPKNYIAQIRLIDYILDNEEEDLLIVKNELKIAKSVVSRIEQMGIVKIVTVRDKRMVDFNFNIKEDPFKKLNEEQEKCYKEIKLSLEKNEFESYLIHGVTGSGKTEIYMHLVNDVLNKNKSCIILVPEISLTPQMIERFVNRFGEKIAIIHSKLSLGERFDEWLDIKNGKKKIVIGARSAIFSPLDNLGMIIIDEEHENTYKSNRAPKYETYEIAKFKLMKTRGVLVSGSATPQIESYAKVKSNEMKLITLEKRINNRKMPEVEIVDMREELNIGNKSIFSNKLFNAINDRLERNEQVIIFLNRKGYSSFVSCRACGYALECPNCEISLTYHKERKSMECSYCGYKTYIPKTCPECGSKHFKLFGIGTEKVEEITKKTFKNANVGRLDSQTTRKKGSLNDIIKKFEDETYDILIGTQMVTKGFDFENVTLVGILAADLIINFPDFSSSERAFQLITQVAGRAGRGDKEGEVILQTYEPDHPALIAASNHNFNEFLNEELKIRNVFEYPPFVKLINIIFYSENEPLLLKETSKFKKLIEKEINLEKVKVFGPNKALHSKIRGKYRYQIFFKIMDNEYNNVKESIKNIIDGNEFKVYITVDVKPRNLV